MGDPEQAVFNPLLLTPGPSLPLHVPGAGADGKSIEGDQRLVEEPSARPGAPTDSGERRRGTQR